MSSDQIIILQLEREIDDLRAEKENAKRERDEYRERVRKLRDGRLELLDALAAANEAKEKAEGELETIGRDCERVIHQHHACVYRSLVQSIRDRILRRRAGRGE